MKYFYTWKIKNNNWNRLIFLNKVWSELYLILSKDNYFLQAILSSPTLGNSFLSHALLIPTLSISFLRLALLIPTLSISFLRHALLSPTKGNLFFHHALSAPTLGISFLRCGLYSTYNGHFFSPAQVVPLNNKQIMNF